jgi:hypothetical protein
MMAMRMGRLLAEREGGHGPGPEGLPGLNEPTRPRNVPSGAASGKTLYFVLEAAVG